MPTIVMSASCRARAAAVCRVSSDPTTVDDDIGAQPVREVADLGHQVGAGGEREVSTALDRQIASGVPWVDRDHPSAVVARRICTARCPSPPMPMTTAVAVGPSLL